MFHYNFAELRHTSNSLVALFGKAAVNWLQERISKVAK
jgi:hypothetical protein